MRNWNWALSCSTVVETVVRLISICRVTLYCYTNKKEQRSHNRTVADVTQVEEKREEMERDVLQLRHFFLETIAVDDRVDDDAAMKTVRRKVFPQTDDFVFQFP